MIQTPSRMRLCIGLLTANVLFIWGNSLLPGEISGNISRWVKDLILSILQMPPAEATTGHGLLRKLAHFTEFCALGMCLRWLFGMIRNRKADRFILPAAAGFLVACIDEMIQLFIPGRGPGIRDVGIDTLGVISGIVFINLFWQRKRKKHLEEIQV